MSKENMTIRHAISIAADVPRVWTVLTEPSYVPQWLGCMRYENAVVGNVFYMQQDEAKRNKDDIGGATHCEILTLDEPGEFAFSWYFPDTPTTEVHIFLKSGGDGTEATLVHDGWEKFDAAVIRDIRDALAGGWKSFVLPNLKRVAEGDE